MHNNQSEDKLDMVSDDVESICKILAPDLFCDNPDKRHMTASPLQVKYAQAPYIKKAQAIAAMRPADSVLVAENKRLKWLLTQIMFDLPEKRDWLNPDYEREAKALTKES